MKTQTNQHTPGPWRYSSGLSGEAFKNSAVPIYAGRTFGGTVCEVIPHPSGEHHANAALIAAAPDMLAALRYVIDWKEGTAWDADTARAMVKAAISKAEGHA